VQNDRLAPRYPLQSVDHALGLLRLLTTRPTVRIGQAADELGVARSTAHRLLAMLVYRGFAARQADRSYCAGPALTEMGLAVLANLDVRGRAAPVLERLAHWTGETVSLLVLEGTTVHFVDSLESTNVVRVSSRVGVRMPAYATSGGKALLALLTAEQVCQLFPEETLAAVTQATLRSRAQLLAELDRVRELGYAMNGGESEPGLAAVAVAVADRYGRPLVAMAVAGPASRLSPLRCRQLVPRLFEARDALQATLYG
jgi:IclR family acetate operon transcriptional repressor